MTVLNRDTAKASAIYRAFPNVKIVDGSLDDEDVLLREAKAADIVLSKLCAIPTRLLWRFTANILGPRSCRYGSLEGHPDSAQSVGQSIRNQKSRSVIL